MPVITLPDNSKQTFAEPVRVFEVAQTIGSGLAKAAIAAKVDDVLVDLSFVIKSDVGVAIVTAKDADGLSVIRHSTAHLLAHAVKSLFPAAQITIGPVIESGFYYDIAYERTFTPEDLVIIENKMKALAQADLPITRMTMSRAQTIELFQQQGELYKTQLIADIPDGDAISLYRQDDFTDLCRGPHVPSTGKLTAFKLTHVSGSYWRGDAKNAMLQRIYGTAWADKKALKTYLHQIEEAAKRDHRKIGKQLDLFHLQEDAPGMIFWHQKGWQIYQIVEQYIRNKLKENGYIEVKTPQLVGRRLWEQSGHWDKFGDMIFTCESEGRDYAVKPMNCPCHIQIFNHGLKSYRDLPLRMAEFGSCHRNEPSGTLHGLMRVRNFVQDDAHIFCTEAQIEDEVSHFIDLLFEVYRDFGFEDIQINLSTRPEQRVGDDAIWDKAEKALTLALDHKDLAWQLQPGEGAFYGPKIDFSLRDCLNRVWQLGTIQVDFSMPGRLNASFVDENNTKQIPVMLHRAILGSLERFIGILTEQYAGAFPIWLAPVQVIVLNISEPQSHYAEEVEQKLKKLGIRCVSDLRNEKIGFKIREYSMQRVPYQLVVGDREMENRTVSVRKRGGEDLGSMSIQSFSSIIAAEIATYSEYNATA